MGNLVWLFLVLLAGSLGPRIGNAIFESHVLLLNPVFFMQHFDAATLFEYDIYFFFIEVNRCHNRSG